MKKLFGNFIGAGAIFFYHLLFVNIYYITFSLAIP